MRSFKSALKAGHKAERDWVNKVRSSGKSVAHGKKIVVKNHCKQTGHVESPDAVALFAIEIKERSLKFSNPETYPYDTVFVDDLRGLEMEKKTFPNLIYIYKSKPTGKWVWLTLLDRNEEWEEGETYDRGRKHKVPLLIAPKKHLRSSESLLELLFPHQFLELVDGDTELFINGGGEIEKRDHYVAQKSSRAGTKTKRSTRKSD